MERTMVRTMVRTGTAMIALLLWPGMARAGIPLVYDGEVSADVVERAARGTGLPDTQFDPVTLEALLKGPPQTLGSAVVRHCSGPPTRAADLLANAVRAENAWQKGDPIVAMDELDLGIGGLGCLAERVDPAIMSRMFLLRGGLLARGGHPDEARAELRTALSLSATRDWPANFPAEGAPAFAEVQAEPERVPLQLAPSSSGAAPSVDGATMPAGSALQLRPGLHLLQVPSTAGLRSAWLTVEGPSTLVVPSSFRRPILEQLSDPSKRDDVGMLLLATLDVQAVYVAHTGGLWLVSEEGGTLSTTTLIEPSAAAPAPPKKGKKGKKQEDILLPEPSIGGDVPEE